METMTKEGLAMLLNGREIGAEITREEEAIAKASGLVVIYGYSDDLIELSGAIEDEVGAFDGTEFRIDADGVIPDERDDEWTDEEMQIYFRRNKAGGLSVVATFGEHDEYTWFITTEERADPAPFDVMEGGEFFCRGIVIDLPRAGV